MSKHLSGRSRDFFTGIPNIHSKLRSCAFAKTWQPKPQAVFTALGGSAEAPCPQRLPVGELIAEAVDKLA
jgi:hypothetical protein